MATESVLTKEPINYTACRRRLVAVVEDPLFAFVQQRFGSQLADDVVPLNPKALQIVAWCNEAGQVLYSQMHFRVVRRGELLSHHAQCLDLTYDFLPCLRLTPACQ